MKYNKSAISSLNDDKIETFIIYEQHGDGSQGGTPYSEGRTLKTIDCTEFDAWIISESMQIERNDIISKRSSWESPNIRYKRK